MVVVWHDIINSVFLLTATIGCCIFTVMKTTTIKPMSADEIETSEIFDSLFKHLSFKLAKIAIKAIRRYKKGTSSKSELAFFVLGEVCQG